MAIGPVAKHSKEPFQLKFLKAEIAPRKNDNELDPFVNISNFVRNAGIGKLRKSIDTNDFTIGLFDQNNLNLVLDNSDGFFNHNEGLFSNRIENRSKVRITAGYLQNENIPRINNTQVDSEITFEGVINSEGTQRESARETTKYKVLSYISIIKNLKAQSGVVTNGMTFQNAFFNLLNVFEITQYLTVDIGNINPNLDLTIDDSTPFEDVQLDEAIDNLLLFSNSVINIKNNAIIIKSREESDEVKFQFFGKGSQFPSNILNIFGDSPGQKRVITRIQFPFVSIPSFEAPSAIQDRFGSKLKKIDFAIVTDTSKLQTIANNILDEFSIPKREFNLTTSYIGEEVELLDMITVDNPGYSFDLNAARYGTAEYGDAIYAELKGGLKITPDTGFKVLSIEHDYSRYLTTLKVREIGAGLFDGNLTATKSLYGSAVYGSSVYA